MSSLRFIGAVAPPTAAQYLVHSGVSPALRDAQWHLYMHLYNVCWPSPPRDSHLTNVTLMQAICAALRSDMTCLVCWMWAPHCDVRNSLSVIRLCSHCHTSAEQRSRSQTPYRLRYVYIRPSCMYSEKDLWMAGRTYYNCRWVWHSTLH